MKYFGKKKKGSVQVPPESLVFHPESGDNLGQLVTRDSVGQLVTRDSVGQLFTRDSVGQQLVTSPGTDRRARSASVTSTTSHGADRRSRAGPRPEFIRNESFDFEDMDIIEKPNRPKLRKSSDVTDRVKSKEDKMKRSSLFSFSLWDLSSPEVVKPKKRDKRPKSMFGDQMAIDISQIDPQSGPSNKKGKKKV